MATKKTTSVTATPKTLEGKASVKATPVDFLKSTSFTATPSSNKIEAETEQTLEHTSANQPISAYQDSELGEIKDTVTDDLLSNTSDTSASTLTPVQQQPTDTKTDAPIQEPIETAPEGVDVVLNAVPIWPFPISSFRF